MARSESRPWTARRLSWGRLLLALGAAAVRDTVHAPERHVVLPAAAHGLWLTFDGP